jgi:hypothetical protein
LGLDSTGRSHELAARDVLTELALQSPTLALRAGDPSRRDRHGVLVVEQRAVVAEFSIALGDRHPQVGIPFLRFGVWFRRTCQRRAGVVNVIRVETDASQRSRPGTMAPSLT